jgi:hypothetical protein
MSWFKRHFTCIRAREISDLDNENYKNAVIQSIRNDLKNDNNGLADKRNNNLAKNSNEFRDYTKNCEGKFLAHTFYNLNVDSEQWLNQRVNICDKKDSDGCFGRKATAGHHECDDKQCN